MTAEGAEDEEAGRGQRRRRRRPKAAIPLAPLVFAAITGLLAAAAAIGVAAPDVGLGAPLLAAGPAIQADRALRISPVDYALASQRNDAVLAISPLSAEALVRKAFIARQQRGGLDAGAVADLERSYRAAPYGPDITRWRLRFLFEHWSELPADLRARAVSELEVFTRFNTGSAEYIREIESPSGRMAASLISRRVYRSELRQAGTNLAR